MIIAKERARMQKGERKKRALCVYSTLRRGVSQFLGEIVLKESQKEQETTRKKSRTVVLLLWYTQTRIFPIFGENKFERESKGKRDVLCCAH